MLLAIDIGNTSIGMGVFEGEGLMTFKVNTHPLKPAEEHAKFIRGILKKKVPYGAVLCSVVPGQTGPVSEGVKLATGKEPLVVTPDTDHGLTLDVDTPSEVGTDRIAESAGAAGLYGVPVAVVDFGTATNINFIDEGNVYLGGAILPGPTMMGRALASATAKLPDVRLEALDSALGRDTKSSILSGIIYGAAGAAERIVAEVEAQRDTIFRVAITGGAHEYVLPHLTRADHVEPALTLKGLKLIYERSR
jgi:type III pantothenate kinase